MATLTKEQQVQEPSFHQKGEKVSSLAKKSSRKIFLVIG